MAGLTFRKILRRLFGDFSILFLLLGLVFFAASLTPSLIPRGPTEQGVLGGLLTAIGYLLAQSLLLLWRAAQMPELPRRAMRWVTWGASVSVLVLFLVVLGSSLNWQNELRLKMGMEPSNALHLAWIVAVSSLTFLVAYAAGRSVASFFRFVRAWFYKVMPPRRANILGLIAVVLILFVVTRDEVFDRTVVALDQSYEAAQALFDKAPPAPTQARMTGSSKSLVDWGGIGKPGRDFILSGPDAEAISSFTGKPALDPIRVYVGRANAETPKERAELALAELKRLGAFDRKVLIIVSPTGTGWMDPGSHDPVEYMHNGDIATVSVQYSYLQSPLALLLETQSGLEQATALQDVVYGYWRTLPKDQRPKLYVHGLSLGAWSSMYATNLFRLLDDPIDGAFWAGPPFPSTLWNYVQNQREPGSPWVLPTIGDGSLVRYASHVADASQGAPWGDIRIVFLQYSSDPIVFYDPASIWRAPPWMLDPPAEDMSEHFVFIPIVTHFQLLLDMALAFGSPPGHGHAYYAQDYIAPWVETTAPEDWSAADTARLKAHCDNGVQMGCSNTAE